MPGRGNILVVDGEAVIVELLVEFLTEEGYRVRTASDGPGAMAEIVHQVPELILFDLGYPSGQGSKFVEQVCTAGRASTPMVLMSTNERTAAQPLMHGVAACIVKPFDLYELLECVARYVQPSVMRSYETVP